MGKFPKKHVFFSQKLASEAKKVVKKKKEGGKRTLKKAPSKLKKKKRAHKKKTAGKKGGRNRAPSFLVNLVGGVFEIPFLNSKFINPYLSW